MFNIFWYLLKQDMRMQGRAVESLLFFVLVVVLAHFSANAEASFIQPILFSALWLCVHVAFAPVFQTDFTIGRLEQFKLSSYPFTALIGVRILGVYLTSVLPSCLIVPFISGEPVLMVSFIGVGLGVSAVAAVAACLLVGSRKSFAMATLLVLPLSAPLVLFGAGVWSASSLSLPYQVPFGLGLGLAVLVTTAAPFVCAAVLKMKLAD